MGGGQKERRVRKEHKYKKRKFVLHGWLAAEYMSVCVRECVLESCVPMFSVFHI